ncbi:hypothetical protein ROD_17151 [Citrobacter rodentium ICC168]|uniref:Uncharacterized protein n=1 Tax=Citrobacter rodentium (strain ICC168) TaxID=637910 RepID=D2TKD0_CITRI|nr:hypothetical protein ROD_17151 [Citrobacter rodentium ICC168]
MDGGVVITGHQDIQHCINSFSNPFGVNIRHGGSFVGCRINLMMQKMSAKEKGKFSFAKSDWVSDNFCYYTGT